MNVSRSTCRIGGDAVSEWYVTAPLLDVQTSGKSTRARIIPESEFFANDARDIYDATMTWSKGLGEGGTIGASAAGINAISDQLRLWGLEAATHARAAVRQ